MFKSSSENNTTDEIVADYNDWFYFHGKKKC